MRYEKISLSEITTDGPDAARFSFSFEPEVGELAESIKEVGLARPPILRRLDDGFEVVCGLRRALACKSLGWSEVDVFVYDYAELSNEKGLRLSLADNDVPGRLSAVERAIALKKFSGAGYDADRLAREIAPMLGAPSSRKYIEDCLALLSLDVEILRLVHDGSFGIDQAFQLLKLEAELRTPAFRVLSSCRANVNETRELLSIIPDVAAMKNLSSKKFIKDELGPIIGDESEPPRRRLERLREHLRRTRYPRLTQAEAQFEAAVDDMKLGDGCRIAAPRYFEGDEITITIKGKDAGRIGEALERLSPEKEQGLEKLFAILRGSDGPNRQ
jgi:ParB/RepB/Spo0J family partition protein